MRAADGAMPGATVQSTKARASASSGNGDADQRKLNFAHRLVVSGAMLGCKALHV